MIQIIKILVSLLPVIIFLSVLVLFDSFRLVNFKSILKSTLLGGIAALLCLGINNWLISQFEIEYISLTRYAAPLVEEVIKAALIIYFIRSANLGFMVDAAIFGFSIGAGFALVENMYYMQYIADRHLFIWILRGLGTAVMHGATTAIFAVVSKYLSDRLSTVNFLIYLPGLVLAIFIHSLFNHLLIPAEWITVIQLVTLPLIFWLVFIYSEKALHRWLELGLDTEVGLLEFLTSGTISNTKVGHYLQSLKNNLSGEVIVDMICYLRVYLELSVRAKGILLMQQSGYKISIDPELRDKLNELKYLEKSIGKTGKRALATIFRADTKELWQLYMLYTR